MSIRAVTIAGTGEVGRRPRKMVLCPTLLRRWDTSERVSLCTRQSPNLTFPSMVATAFRLSGSLAQGPWLWSRARRSCTKMPCLPRGPMGQSGSPSMWRALYHLGHFFHVSTLVGVRGTTRLTNGLLGALRGGSSGRSVHSEQSCTQEQSPQIEPAVGSVEELRC